MIVYTLFLPVSHLRFFLLRLDPFFLTFFFFSNSLCLLKFYYVIRSVSLTVSALIEAAAAKIRKPHLEAQICMVSKVLIPIRC